MPNGQHAKRQTGFRLSDELKKAAQEKATADGGPGTLNAAVERLLEAWTAGQVTLPGETAAGLSLAELRRGSGFPRGARFVQVQQVSADA